MIGHIMDYFFELERNFSSNAERTIFAINNPNHRIYFAYLVTPVIISYVIFKSSKAGMSSDEKTFVGFLFSQKVWILVDS